MKIGLLAAFILATIITANIAYADYEYYPQIGNNQKYSSTFSSTIGSSYTVTQISTAAGSYFEPLVFDIDGDSKSEIFIPQSTGGIGSYNGATGFFNSSISGTLASQPATCDMNGDGKLDYVAIVENGGTYSLITAGYTRGRFTVNAVKNVTPINSTSNVMCGAFYQNQGDNDFYAMWIDQNKYFNIWKQNGNTFTGRNYSVMDSVTHDAQMNNSAIYSQGSHNIVYSNSFDTGGNGMVIFYAGHRAYAHFSNDFSVSTNISPLANAGGTENYYPLNGVVRLYGNVNYGDGAVLFYFGGDERFGTDGAKPFYSIVTTTQSLFGEQTLNKNNFSIDTTYTILQPFNRVKALNALGLKTYSQNDDRLYALLYQQGTNGISHSEYRVVETDLNGNVITSVTYDEPHTGSIANKDRGGGIMLADMNGDNVNDIVMTEGKLTYMTLSYLSGATNHTAKIPIVNFSNTENLVQTTPVTVDFNDDGSPDFIINGAFDGQTYLISSNGEVGQDNPPLSFTANLVESGDLQTKSIIRSSEDLGVYYYSVACNIEQTPLWSEILTTGYNSTIRNTTIGMPNGSYSIGFDGLTYTIPNNIESFYFEKTYDESFFDYGTLNVEYSSADNHKVNVLVYGTNDFITQWLQVERNGTNLSFYKKRIGYAAEYLGSSTLSGDEINLNINYVPITDYVGRRTYFNVSIVLNNQSPIYTDTTSYPVSVIKNVLFTSQTVNATIGLKSMSVYKGNNILTPQVQFRNGVNQTIGGVPVSSGGNVTINSGYGYRVITDYNNQFYSTCSYNSPGVYTQRHYLNRQNDFLSYQNFMDVRVNVLESPLGDVQDADNMDSLEAGITSLLGSLGLKSTAGKMFFWVVLTMIFVIGLFTVHWLLGISSFVILTLLGAVLGFIPLWVILIFVILCAGIAALGYRTMVSGD